jgi:exodeoxyribonuclease V alpha subunit
MLAKLLAQAAARRQAEAMAKPASPVVSIATANLTESIASNLYYDAERGISYNQAQSEFINLLSKGNSCVLVGAAGTGKTTCMKGALNALIQSGKVPLYANDGHKHLTNATHGILICAFTRRAVANIKKNLSHDMRGSCITVHAALEYAPEYYDVLDPITQEYKSTMRFSPTRNSHRPLAETIKYCVIEESSMLGVDLFKELQSALPSDCKYIFLGDIQQLPPVFGSAILGFKMLELPVIELTEVYRQALESPIISLAHRILEGKEMAAAEMAEWNTKYAERGLSFHPIKKRLHPEHITPRIASFLKKELAEGRFDPEQDTCLIPFNKGLGTLEMNKELAQYLTTQRGDLTYEIIAGFNKLYYAIGDKVLYEKEDAVIISINKNSAYASFKKPKPASATLDRWGYDTAAGKSLEGEIDLESDFDLDAVDSVLDSMRFNPAEDKERKQESSHVITIRMLSNDEEVSLSKASELNNLLLGYCLTVHKSQGSEWRRTYIILHQSHNTMIARELLYTAVTRARESCYIICEPDTFEKGITRQKVPGNTIAEKAIHFQGKTERGEY